ncbi:hypothetical protein [Mycobacterium sp. SMC-8]|uniref:hypothetical protein n=1 Tax=Mycobacterium sp. SMC-8 TaxID=2857060 RepID=UPI0021B1AFF4|nr:hypothetical protein [Mycobacterium sp. SMC-8]
MTGIGTRFSARTAAQTRVLDAALARLEPALEAAEAEQSAIRARELLHTQVIDEAVERRCHDANSCGTPSG